MSERNPAKDRRTDKSTDAGTEPAGGGQSTGSGQPTGGGGGQSIGSGQPTGAGGAPETAFPLPPGVRSAPRPVGPRRERYLVAHLGPSTSGLTAFDAGPLGTAADNVFAQLHADPSCTVHRVITASPAPTRLTALGTAPIAATFPHVAVVEMEADRAAMFASGPMVHVEPDLPLQYTAPQPTFGLTFADPGVIPLGDETSVIFAIIGSDGKALEGAEVYLMSEAFPVRGVTGADGRVVLNTPAGALPALRGIYVKPRYDYWAVWLGQPELTLDMPNLVTCPSIAETFPGFPERHLDGWARRAMRFDALPPTFRGHGVKIAVIDSGAAIDHPDLADRVTAGRDIPGENDTGWRVDTVGHGSHCAGIIGGTDNGSGVVGVVPEAELHSCKIFPGGRFSDLIEAIDYCIANQIDVVNLSLGSPQPSELLARKIEQARQAGVACIVAAGNSGGAVCFPASMSSVLAVAAVGKTGEYPPESYHATQVYGVPTPDGYFSASFTCFGPEIDVCAPGVAIVSSVPPTNYAAWDGTSFAAPYVSGLAALLLAHHADFRDRYTARDAGRVDRLFDIIRSSSRPLRLGDPGRSGAGLPDAVVALGLVPPVTMTPPTHPLLAQLWTVMAQAGLTPVPMPTVPAAMHTVLPGGSLPAVSAMLAAESAAALAAMTGTVMPLWAGPTGAPFPFWAAPGGASSPIDARTGVVDPGTSVGSAPGRDAHGAAGSGPAGSSGPGAVPGTATNGPTGGDQAEAATATRSVQRPGATLTAPTTEALGPLRAAMRAAGLLPHAPE